MLKINDGSTQGPSTIIGTTVTLIGVLRDQNDITVHGTVEGEIHSERTVTIGEAAIIKGPIVATTIIVAGAVRGSLEAKHRLEILSTGKVYGSISARDLTIKSGAVFIGKSTMPENELEKTEVEPSPSHSTTLARSEEQPTYEVE